MPCFVGIPFPTFLPSTSTIVTAIFDLSLLFNLNGPSCSRLVDTSFVIPFLTSTIYDGLIPKSYYVNHNRALRFVGSDSFLNLSHSSLAFGLPTSTLISCCRNETYQLALRRGIAEL